MSWAQTFNIGYLKTGAGKGEEVFLSVTDNFEYGPGIIRDGVTIPRMRDPHRDPRVMSGRPIWDVPETTTNAHVQRAGTWTIFHHLKRFLEEHKDEYLVVGIQSCGDLTMNPWHVALIHRGGQPILCRLMAPAIVHRVEPDEPFMERTYRCLIKWKRDLAEKLPWKQNFVDLKFFDTASGFAAKLVDDDHIRQKEDVFKEAGIDLDNISPSIEFALSGKPIIQKGSEIPLNTVIDRFQDVRHIFNLPEVPAIGHYGVLPLEKINFGEHELYEHVNSRRAALHSPILIPFRLGNVMVEWNDLERAMVAEHFKREEDAAAPGKRGYYRKYSDTHAEIFFPYNVYPFGVLGGKTDELVCLASGGLSGRIGNTLAGITTIMYDFFGCEEALILDEGFDTFHIVNPNRKLREDADDDYVYDNKRLLDEVALFTLEKFKIDQQDCRASLVKEGRSATEFYSPGGRLGLTEDMAEWPLNKPLIEDLRTYCQNVKLPSDAQDYPAIAVKPHRSQIRAVIIFAVPHTHAKSE